MSRKRMTFVVTVTVPAWLSSRDARREVRTLINDQCNYLSTGPNGEYFDGPNGVRAVAVKPARGEASHD